MVENRTKSLTRRGIPKREGITNEGSDESAIAGYGEGPLGIESIARNCPLGDEGASVNVDVPDGVQGRGKDALGVTRPGDATQSVGFDWDGSDQVAGVRVVNSERLIVPSGGGELVPVW